MVKSVIYYSVLALFASSVLAAPHHRREVSEDDLLARESDTANLQEREPFFGALIGMAARIGGRVAARAGSKAARSAVRHVDQRRRKRDLEAEDELDLAARDELVEGELDMVEREMDENDILEREVEEEDVYLD